MTSPDQSDAWVLLGVHLRREDIEGSGAEAFEAGDLFLSAVRYARSRGTADREVVSRAAAARQELIRRETFIAIRYGASVGSAAEAAAKCEAHLERWRTILRTAGGRVEMTLKVSSENPVPRPDRRTAASGRAYLQELYRTRRIEQVIDPEFRARADGLFAPLADKSRWQSREDGGAELAMLVQRSTLDQIRHKGMELKKAFPGVPFLLSGPWPLEIFADET